MALNLEDKKTLVAEVAEVAAKAHSVVAAEYRGLTVSQMTELRTKARLSGVYMRVVKNTLARKALAGTSLDLSDRRSRDPWYSLRGRSGRGCARGEGLCEGQRQAGSDTRFDRWAGSFRHRLVEQVASLPTREQALSMLWAPLGPPCRSSPAC